MEETVMVGEKTLNQLKEYTEKKEIQIFKSIKPERLIDEGETYLQYKIRQYYIRKASKNYFKGQMFWDSEEKGTYVNPK